MVEGYAGHEAAISVEDLRAKAVEWSMTRGARSGRVACSAFRMWPGNWAR